MRGMLYGAILSVLIVIVVIISIYYIFFKVYEHIEEQAYEEQAYIDCVRFTTIKVEVTKPFLIQLRKNICLSIYSESISVNEQNEIWRLCCSLPGGVIYHIMLQELLRPLQEKYDAIYKPIPRKEWNSAVMFCRKKIYRIVLNDIDTQLECIKKDELEKQRIMEETKQKAILEKQRIEEQAKTEIENKKKIEEKELEMKAREIEYLAKKAKEKREKEAIETKTKEKKAIEDAIRKRENEAQKEAQRKKLNVTISSLEEELLEVEKANTKRVNRIAYLEKRLVDTQEVDTMRNPNPIDIKNRRLWRLELHKLQDDYTYRERKRLLKVEINRIKNKIPLQDAHIISKDTLSLGVTSEQCISKVSIDIPSGTLLIKALYMIAMKNSIKIDTKLIKIDERVHSDISIKNMSPITALKFVAEKNGYYFSKGNKVIIFKKK